MGWQYAHVSWLALATETHKIGKPPEGDGWIRNKLAGQNGFDVSVPSWSDGSIVHRRVYWRRRMPGVRRPHPKQSIVVSRRPWFVGSVIPYERLCEIGVMARVNDTATPGVPYPSSPASVERFAAGRTTAEIGST
ncbi:hypothetical protein ACFCV3_39630 [Kribbella sp. NPDC056345]|uniref:hypothetical protein n=1 Tax=Kribbella sp. NPDC056345 TaxID=3345789 RepID=UPI0035E39D09